MLNFGLIARQEFRKMIGTRTFLVATIGVPLLIVVMMGIGALASVSWSATTSLLVL
jgi:ABC-type Na+ efflux pump permease subunit